MSRSLALVLVHIIFSTKNRMAFLQSPEHRSEVRAYLPEHCELGKANRFRWVVLQIMSTSSVLSRKTSVAELIKNLKTSSTEIVKSKAIPISAGGAAMLLSRLANRARKRSFPTLQARKSTIAK